MAWRPTQHLIEGELDNTTPGKVTGWMQFAGLKDKVTFDLKGSFHRDVRGAKIHLTGQGDPEDVGAERYMDGFALHHTGNAGDITAGDPPADYVDYPYIEWYSDQNGRVVIELNRDQVRVIGRPIPACESDPISRTEQRANMAGFLTGLSTAMQAPAVTVGSQVLIVSDPAFTHWVVVDNKIVGEAHSVEPGSNGQTFAYVRLFGTPEMAEYGYMATSHLRSKAENHTS